MDFLVRVVFEVGDSGDEESIFLNVSVPCDRNCTIKEYINDYVKKYTHQEYGIVNVYSFVDRFYID